MSDSLAERLAAYTADMTVSNLDGETIGHANNRILDSLSCAYAAIDEPPVQATLAWADRKSGETPASIIGGGEAAVDAAAMANGTLIRYLDWNDTYLSLEPGHPSDNLGAVLSVADAQKASGEKTILAIALAYEVQCRLCNAASLRKNGFDHVNYGLVSATLAVGKLMSLNESELADAVRLAVNAHIALRQARAGELSEWKGMAFGNVSRNAVVAAELAREGIEGPAPIFEGKFGFFSQVTGEFDLDIDSFGGREGEWLINETYIKFYPVEYHAQAAVNCALALRDEHDIDPVDIKHIENESYEAGVSIIAGENEKWRPKTRETADHSMPYCITRAFLDGDVTIDSFAPEKLRATDARELMDRITVEENEEFTERYGESFPHRMIVHTTEGRYEHTIEYPKGHPEHPLTDEELAAKFEMGAADRLTSEERKNILSMVLNFTELPDVSELFALI